MNAIFGLSLQLAIGKDLVAVLAVSHSIVATPLLLILSSNILILVAYKTGTAVHVPALPPTRLPWLSSVSGVS